MRTQVSGNYKTVVKEFKFINTAGVTQSEVFIYLFIILFICNNKNNNTNNNSNKNRRDSL